MRATQRKGDIAKARAISYFTCCGYDVSLPLTESAAYDLIVDDEGILYRVQVKWSKGRYVDMRRIHSNSAGYVVKVYAENAFDWLFVVRPDGTQYLLKQMKPGQRYVTLQDSFRATTRSCVPSRDLHLDP